MSDEPTSLVVSNYLESRLLRICHEEGLIEIPQWFLVEIPKIMEASISPQDRSQIFASVFLNPSVRLSFGTDHDFLQTKSIIFEPSSDAQRNPESMPFHDFNLLTAYAMEMQPDLTPDRIRTLIINLIDTKEIVMRQFGAMPNADGNGNPVLLTDSIASFFSRTPRPTYSADQIRVFREYRSARDAADTIVECHNELTSIWERRGLFDGVAIHPGINRSYNEIVASTDIQCIGDETELFFIAIRELRTLPVGRTLRETLELSASPQGVALRARVRDLYSTVSNASPGAIQRAVNQIKAEADEYRAFTSRVQSPHSLSMVTDLIVAAASPMLLGVIGALVSAGVLAKSMYAMVADGDVRLKMRSRLWAEYKGTSI
jgi:hypothetical protein